MRTDGVCECFVCVCVCESSNESINFESRECLVKKDEEEDLKRKKKKIGNNTYTDEHPRSPMVRIVCNVHGRRIQNSSRRMKHVFSDAFRCMLSVL